MKILATKVKAKELQPGDLFSTMGQEYWTRATEEITLIVGEKVYIRTNNPSPKSQGEDKVYRIDIQYEN